MKPNILLGGAVLIGGLAYFLWTASEQSNAETASHGAALAEVTVPEALSEAAQQGEAIFAVNCAVCHGDNASGIDGSGPPLIHRIYEPNHHGDPSFYMAVANGVRQHHWRFGDMAPVEGVGRDDVAMIIAYIRELQRANGIY